MNGGQGETELPGPSRPAIFPTMTPLSLADAVRSFAAAGLLRGIDGLRPRWDAMPVVVLGGRRVCEGAVGEEARSS